MIVRARAPAKTNLFLEVRGKRSDGYHELDTIFAELDLADELTFEPAATLELSSEGDPNVPSGSENLAWRAADALRKHVKRPDLGARISITKVIPSGGGLGGGSADATVTLIALDRLWGLGLGARALTPIAASLGSDCAFFLEGGLARGTGRGEILASLPPIERPLDLVLLCPDASCPTPLVYKALAPHLRSGEPRGPELLLAALAKGDAAAVARDLWNRLEAPCFELFPEVARAKADLERRSLLGCLLSGSGATVFGIARDRAHAEATVDHLRAEGKRAFATRAGIAGPRLVRPV